MATTARASDFNTASELGARAAARREELGLTQAQVARRIGRSREWVLRFERGNPGASLQGAFDVLRELDIILSEKIATVPIFRARTTTALRKEVPTLYHGKNTPAKATTLPAGRPSFVVVDSLSTLHGPSSGEVTLPKRILWNPSRPFDLSNDKRAVTLLRLVLLEARKREDLEAFIDLALLKRLWGQVRLPVYIRKEWETKFPELAQSRELAHT
jgi:transcriptional regulator with XRE-family HTH domain